MPERSAYWKDPRTYPLSKAAHKVADEVAKLDAALGKRVHDAIAALDANADALLSEALGAQTPVKRPTFATSSKAALPASLTAAYARVSPWLKDVQNGPMQNIRNGKRATSKDLDFDIFGHRWIDTMYTFPLQAQVRAFGLEQPVKDIAALYLDYLPTFKDFGNLPLEWCITSGVIAGDLMVMRDNLHIPECVAAEKAMRQKLAEFKAFLKEQVAKHYPGKPYWWPTQNFPHPLISFCLFLWVDHQVTGDEESLEGFNRIGAQLTDSFVYGKSKSGIELVNFPHFIPGREIDMKPNAKPGRGSFDRTYIETFAAAAIKHHWLGTGLIDTRFLAALGHTTMLTEAPEGFATFGLTMAEALCGAVKVGAKSRNGEEVLILQGGAEVVSTPGVTANRTTSRQHSVVEIRGGHFSAVPFAVAKNPEMAELYHKNLDDACKQQKRAQAPALWRLISEAQPKGYLEGAV